MEGSGLNFYRKSSIRSLANWDILVDAEKITVGDVNYIEVDASGYCGCTLSSSYNNGLSASMYRLLQMKVYCTAASEFDYQNKIEAVLKVVYVTNEGDRYSEYITVPLTLLDSTEGTDSYGDYLVMTRLIQMENYSIESMILYVKNHTTSTITLADCTLQRSMDINGNQVGDSIGWGIALRSVVAYLDGVELYYEGAEEPDKLWWLEDENNNFAGINVNNERMISFERRNEILID